MKRLLLKMKLSLWDFLTAATLFAVRFFCFGIFLFPLMVIFPNIFLFLSDALSELMCLFDLLVDLLRPLAQVRWLQEKAQCGCAASRTLDLFTHTHTHIDLEWMHRGRLFRASRLATNCMIMQSKEGSPWTRLWLLADSFLVGESLNPF